MFLKKGLGLFLSLALLTVFILPGCRGWQVTPRQHLNYDLFSEPASLDPALVSDSAGRQLVNAVFEGLVRIRPDGLYEKAMATGWIQENGTRYVFTIRQAQWSNGEMVTARDFEYAWKRVLDPKTKSPYAFLLYEIKNAEGYNRSEDSDYRGEKKGAGEVGIRALDDRRLEVELGQPNPVFYKKLIHPVFFPVPTGLKNQDVELFRDKKVVGNGPFLISKYEAGKKYELIKNDKYWDRENVSLQSMTWFTGTAGVKDRWQAFQKGQYDLTLNVPQDEIARGLKEGYMLTSPVFASFYCQLNTSKGPLKDIRTRQALSYALNRVEMVDTVLQGGQKPARGIVPPGMTTGQPGSDFRAEGGVLVPDNDLNEAKRLLAEAGFPEGKGFPELEMLVEDEGSHLYLAAYLKSEWKKQLGIEVKIIPLQWEQRTLRAWARQYDLILTGWPADYADAAAFLEKYVFRSGNNDTGWTSREFDEQMKMAAGSEEKERLVYLHRAEDILMAGLPVLPLYDFTRAYAVKPKVKGLCLPPAGPEADFKWVSVSA
ncbi:MAG: peptide ABC transporter substrate-binding protein [Peptococcaceae bacterium]|nr:peptide ABC transporter substrate-binding protein [Peptococcaceae bacterium]MDH7523999.1 peptide ABC transporter substrate-binding protein [Peptococcaceae bacterium]